MPKTRGRKKEQGVERHPCGKKKQPAKVAAAPKSDAFSPTEVHRVREHWKKLGADARAGSEVGRLLLSEALTSKEAGAAWKIAEIYGRYEFLHGKRRSARSASYESGRASAVNTFVADEVADFNLEAEAAVVAAFKSLPMQGKTFPARLRSRIERLCVEDESIPFGWLAEIKAELEKHADHLGTIKAGKKQKTPAKPKAKETPRKQSTPIILRERQSWIMVMQKLRPDLDEGASIEAFDYFKALAARSEFRKDKANSHFKSRAPQNSFAMS